MSQRPVVVRDLHDVQIRLSELGLTVEDLHYAIGMGQAARSSSTDNEPRSAVGIMVWGKTLGGLRERLALRSWRRCSDDRLETAVNEDGSMAIAVAAGDGATGNPERTPKTMHERGVATAEAVQRNNLQLSIWDLMPGYEADTAANDVERNRSNRTTWVLLWYAGADEVRCELSLPESIGWDDRLDQWAERIVLPAYRFEPTDGIAVDDDLGPDINVVVTRKSG